ncbi:hypothetical protein SSP24_60920 [Streptomyces spinoverrucosus]|uniref:Uncharacterized protein n=1 Tax=Streptomyces spinoverrucosus TaxID=284043 RepID=A0A4Y3VNJ5_9ACTN|nr:hypothetical protein SSP24_60920 [Streptomyces spinoverrucosus]GHB94635.1 hypothetical protein GCM10010397_79220 [Streptomyces spinoverrucosus]
MVAGAAAGVRGVPVGERVLGVGEVGLDDVETLVGEVAQTAGDVRSAAPPRPSWTSVLATSTSLMAGRMSAFVDAGDHRSLRASELCTSWFKPVVVYQPQSVTSSVAGNFGSR